MNFGDAIKALKEGYAVQRTGWNGKGMYIYLETDLRNTLFDSRRYEPVIVMYTAQGTRQPGWLASQADILADDWTFA